MEARFRQRYESVRDALESREWNKALDRAARLTEGLRDSVADSRPGWAARTLILRALANAANGNDRRALWDYDVATAFVPAISEIELPDYPPATHLLAGLLAGRELCRDAPDRLEEPKLVERRFAPYPSGMEARGISGVVVIEPCVDRHGIATEPRIIRSAPVPFMLAAFEAMGRWDYESAMDEGRLVPFLAQQTVDFLPVRR